MQVISVSQTTVLYFLKEKINLLCIKILINCYAHRSSGLLRVIEGPGHPLNVCSIQARLYSVYVYGI